MKLTTQLIYHWGPRFLSLILTFFVSAFALDAIEANVTLEQNIQSFLVHLIPGLIIAALAVIAWRHALLGGALFMLLAIIYAIVTFDQMQWVLVISIPLFVLGALFALSFIKLRKWNE
jgi:hypothetical protein